MYLAFGFLTCSVDHPFTRVPCLVFFCMDRLPVFDLDCTLDYPVQ